MIWRSGDFVAALWRNAHNVDELAFAVGALSHYLGDSFGHGEAVNPATGITFPGLAKKYGPIVTFEDEPTAHVRTEFGFDVAQIAQWRYAPRAYRKYIGFRVAHAPLERAYYETYGLEAGRILGRPQRGAFASYHFAVRWIIPLFARATIVSVRRNLPPETARPELQRYLAAIAQTDHAKYWSRYHQKPGVLEYILWVVVKVVPKIGQLKILAVKAPTTETEDLFVRSLDDTLTRFRALLTKFSDDPAGVALEDRDLDTGAKVRPGAYRLTDRTYEKLLHKLTEEPGRPIPARLREDVLAYYADPAAPISTRRDRKAWKRVQEELAVLRSSTPGVSEASFTAPLRSRLGNGAGRE